MKMIDTKEIVREMSKQGKVENVDYRIVYFSNQIEVKLIAA